MITSLEKSQSKSSDQERFIDSSSLNESRLYRTYFNADVFSSFSLLATRPIPDKKIVAKTHFHLDDIQFTKLLFWRIKGVRLPTPLLADKK